MKGLALAIGLGLAVAYSNPALAEDTVEKCNTLVTQLEDKINKKATGETQAKAKAFLERMKDACANRKFMEAGSAGLDIMIELDRTPS
jgi:hypothetical protein